MRTIFKTFYYVSLPVVVGAVLSHKMAARLSGVEQLPWATPIVLALAVWIIYTVDRLLDIRKTDYPKTARHTFHRNNIVLLWQCVAGATIVGILLTFWLPSSIIKFGLILGAACVMYIALVFQLPHRHPALLLKEPLVAILFSAGVWGSVWVQRPSINWIELTEAAMFGAIAFQNLLLFSLMEIQERPNSANYSMATVWGTGSSDLVLRWLTFAVVVAALTICFMTEDRFAQRAAIMQAIMSTVLYVIQRYPTYFLKHERYRWLGDGVFWLPALVL